MSTASIVLGVSSCDRPWRARLLLGFWAVMAVVAVAVACLSEDRRQRPAAPGGGDVALFRSVVGRMGQGESYYAAYAEEAAARGYPTRSVFNWRTPLPLALLGRLPDPVLGKGLLGLLAGLLLLGGFSTLARDTGRLGPGLLGGALLSGPLLLCVLGDIYVMPVLWAGVLIGLSLVAYGRGRRGLGVAAGLAALLVRELALPYVAVAGLMALCQRRWREVMAWTAGGLAWCGWMLVHAQQVAAHMPADAQSHAQGWVCFGGLAFVISTVQAQAYLILLPRWVAALYLVAALTGFAGWSTAWGTRAGLSAAAFLLMLAVVGQPFNQYWGCLTAPLLCLGAAHAPWAVATLIRRSRSAAPAATVAAGRG